jgi:predicted DNA repair protein MutK
MKTRLLLIAAIFLSFTGCEKIKDAASITVSTNLQTSIPITVVQTAMKSADLIAAANAYTFSKSQELSLASNIDISPYLSRINEININNIVITISGLTAGQTINSIALDVTGAGNIFTQTNITSTNNTFTPTIASGVLNQVGTKLKADNKLTITVSGSASGTMTFTIGINMDTRVVVYTI